MDFCVSDKVEMGSKDDTVCTVREKERWCVELLAREEKSVRNNRTSLKRTLKREERKLTGTESGRFQYKKNSTFSLKENRRIK